MNSKEIFKLSDKDLAEVCGGVDKVDNVYPTNEMKKGFYGEMGKFGWAIIAVPVGAFLSTVAVWGAKLLTDKLDKKIEKAKSK